ncbi:MAG: hypothetical protein WCP12_14070 [bacterium]
MKRRSLSFNRAVFFALAVAVSAAAVSAADHDWYVKKATWPQTLTASAETLQGGVGGKTELGLSAWSWAGPFELPGNRELHAVFVKAFEPESGEPATTNGWAWKAAPEWKDGAIHQAGNRLFAAYYVTRRITAPSARKARLWLGFDDAATVWLNGREILSKETRHLCAPDQECVELDLNAGDNRLLIKISNETGIATFYCSFWPHFMLSQTHPVWARVLRDFPDEARAIGWAREDALFGAQPAARFYRYDEPRIALKGDWQYTISGAGPALVGRSFDKAGDTMSIDFIGSSIEFWHRFGSLEKQIAFTPEAELKYGLAKVTVDGAAVPAESGIPANAAGETVIDTSLKGIDLVKGLKPGRHRLEITVLGQPSPASRGGTDVALLGFNVHVGAGNSPADYAWRYAAATRGGEGWSERAAELAGKVTDEDSLKPLQELYFASREVEVLAERLRRFHAVPLPSEFVRNENRYWTPGAAARQYLDRLADVKKQADDAVRAADGFRYPGKAEGAFNRLMDQLRGAVKAVDECLTGEVRKLPPIIFYTGSPLVANAVPNYVWNANPKGDWGCSIRIWNPATPDVPAKVIFEDPKACIFDLTLSDDARTVYFSMRRNREQCWQIYEMGIDGANLKQITSGPHFNVCPVPLPDGRLAFLSSRTPGSHTVCQSGPSMHVHVMNRDGSNARDLSSNTLTDFGLSSLRDGRLIFTRWEYVDSDLGYRQSLWTQYPDGSRFALYFGNTIIDPATFWQAREIPGRNAVVCTLAPHHGSPYGAIGILNNRYGVEAPRDVGFRWITDEFPTIYDLNWYWAYRDPCPVSENQFLVSYGGEGAQRFRIFLLDEMDNKRLVYDDPKTSCFYPQPVVARQPPKLLPQRATGKSSTMTVPAAPPGQMREEKVATGLYVVTDVYQGLDGAIAQGRAKAIRIMEQVPKTVNTTWWRVYDQGPLMAGGTTYYAKRCWGYAPIEADGSAYFEAPAMKEIYFQVCDEEGRELRRMTSATQSMPGEVQSCIGCHEKRETVPDTPSRNLLAMRRPPTPLELPEWGNAGMIDFVRVVQPVLDKHCVSCHSGANPTGGVSLTGHYTRFFNMAYDNLVVRSQSLLYSADRNLGLSLDKPLVQANNMFPGTFGPQKPLTTGSSVSRLPDYLEKKHCKSDVSPAEKRRVYEWIDAMAPYYTTYYSARPGSRGDRDRWGANSGKGLAPWYTEGFQPVYNKHCVACHGSLDDFTKNSWFGKWSWLDLTRPEWSPALTAHLAKDAGGRGLTEKDFGKHLTKRWTERESSLIGLWGTTPGEWHTMDNAVKAGRKVELFKTTSDPVYQEILKAIIAGKQYHEQLPEADMPGFVNRSADKAFLYK